MKLIVSAFTANATPQENAVQTANLIVAAQAFDLCLVQGSYHGVPEVSVQLTGFESVRHLHETAGELLAQFNQIAVYYSVNGHASLLHPDGQHEDIGEEVVYPPHLVNTAMFRLTHKEYSIYPDGSALAVQRAE